MSEGTARVFDKDWNELDRGPLSEVIRRLECRHAYVNSDAHCLHCGADCSAEIAAAVDALNAYISARQGV